MKKGLVLLLAAILVPVLISVVMYFNYSNQEKSLRNNIAAVQTTIQNEFDNLWKTISQQAQISDKYADDFKKIYVEIMDARYDNARGGALLSFVTEANPNFDSSLYSTLMKTIEAKRAEFTNNQNKLRDLKREHDNLLSLFPSSIFLAGRDPIEVIMITSARTKDVYRTGEDNDVDLYRNN